MAAGFASALLNYAVDKGARRDVLLRGSGLSETDLKDQDNRIAVAHYQALIAAAMAETRDTALLLRHTLETELQLISVVGQIVHSSASLAHSIEQLNRYLRLMADVTLPAGQDRFELLRADGELWIVDHLVVPDAEYLGTEASFARFISEFRRSFPGVTFEMAMDVTYPPPPHVDEYPELFRIPVRFNAPRNALRIDPIWGTTESDFEPGNAYAFGVFTRHADALLEDLKADDTMRAMVEAQILPQLHEGSPSMDRVAAAIGVSRQTLYRRLKAEGLTFGDVHDALRKRMALDYLSAQKVSVNETAYLLGFSEASSFVRAFKRWTGRSPTAYFSTVT